MRGSDTARRLGLAVALHDRTSEYDSWKKHDIIRYRGAARRQSLKAATEFLSYFVEYQIVKDCIFSVDSPFFKIIPNFSTNRIFLTMHYQLESILFDFFEFGPKCQLK